MIPIIKKIWINGCGDVIGKISDVFSCASFVDFWHTVVPEINFLIPNISEASASIEALITALSRNEKGFGYDCGRCKITFCTECALSEDVIKMISKQDTRKPRCEINYILRANQLQSIGEGKSDIKANMELCKREHLHIKTTLIEEENIDNILIAVNAVNGVKSALKVGAVSLVESVDYEVHPKLFPKIIERCKKDNEYLKKILRVIVALNDESYMYFCGILSVMHSLSIKIAYGNKYKLCFNIDDELQDCFFACKDSRGIKNCTACYEQGIAFCDLADDAKDIISIADAFIKRSQLENQSVLEADWDYIT